MKKPNPIARMIDEMPLDLSEATVVLFDALREYVRSMEEDEGEWTFPTEKARRNHLLHIQTCKLLLKELEDWQVDMTLHGIVKET